MKGQRQRTPTANRTGGFAAHGSPICTWWINTRDNWSGKLRNCNGM